MPQSTVKSKFADVVKEASSPLRMETEEKKEEEKKEENKEGEEKKAEEKNEEEKKDEVILARDPT